MIIAFDFDETVVKWKGDGLMLPVKNVIDFLKFRKEMDDTLILWTCREGEALDWAVKKLIEWEIPFDYVNENAKEIIDGGKNPKKIEADLYIDSKSINHIHEWPRLEFLKDKYL